MALPLIVIVGGGFAGLHAARALASSAAKVTLIDRRNFHLFQPLLYQVATGALSPANIASPLRDILKGQYNARVLMGEVESIDVEQNELILSQSGSLHGSRLPFDFLILATGAAHSYFGNEAWQAIAPGLKSIEDALLVRQRVLSVFEAAECLALQGAPVEEVQRLMNIVIVGGGPTGVELAGALGEIARNTLKHNFRHINPRDAAIYLVEGATRVLPTYDPELGSKACEALEALGVKVRVQTRVVQVAADAVVLACGSHNEKIPTELVIWAAGVKASPLAQSLATSCGAKCDATGRVMVEANLSLVDYPHIFIAGDCAHVPVEPGGKPLPALASVAMQQGVYLGQLLSKRMRGKKTEPFVYKDYGSMATIGRGQAVAQMGSWRFSGWLAWLAWLFVHLLKLVGFHNKLLVCMQWAMSYVTHNRVARLITYTK